MVELIFCIKEVFINYFSVIRKIFIYIVYFLLCDAIKKMTSGPAQVIGLDDRGLIKEGMRADINVFDADTVGECQPELVHDFPQGAPRYIQRSKGFKFINFIRNKVFTYMINGNKSFRVRYFT